MNVWSLSLPFFLIAAALAVGLTRWAPGPLPAGERGASGYARSPLLHRFAVAVLLALPWALAVAVASALASPALHEGGRTTLFYSAVAATVLPQLLLHSWLTWALFRRGYFTTAGALPHDCVRTGARVAMGVAVLAAVSFMILFLGLSPSVEAYAPVAAILILAMIAIIATSRTAVLADQGRPAEMADSPLRREILAVAASFGWAPRSVRVYQVRREELRPGETEILQGLDQWRTDFNPLRPALPAELLHDAAPSAVTAGMAMRYAHAILLNPFRIPALRLGPVALPGTLVAILMMLVLSIPLFLLFLRQGETAGDAAMLTYWFLVVAGFLAALTAIQVRRRHYHTYAWRAWQAAAPEAGRTPEDFVAALACYDRAMKHVRDPEALLARYRRDAGLMRFLEREGDTTPDRAIAHARTALCTPEPQAADPA